MANEQGGGGPYPGPNHTPIQDTEDWLNAHDAGAPVIRLILRPGPPEAA